MISFNYTPKALHELFCYAQAHLPNTAQGNYFRSVLQDLINEIETHRPLGADGKHGNFHTETCGCEDKWQYPKIGVEKEMRRRG